MVKPAGSPTQVHKAMSTHESRSEAQRHVLSLPLCFLTVIIVGSVHTGDGSMIINMVHCQEIHLHLIQILT